MKLREGGARHAKIMQTLAALIVPGKRLKELNDSALKLIQEGGDLPSFLNYTPDGASRPYPAALCVSINDEIVHGIPNESDRAIAEGDIVSIDLGLTHQGLVTDMALTLPAGNVDEKGKELIEATKKSLQLGIKAIRPGGHIGDIGFAISEFVKKTPFSLVEGLSGHGVGYAVHEDPYVPNKGKKGEGERLEPGMIIAIEPMLSMGSPKITLAEDGYTYKTKDGSRSAHFEHTVLIGEKGPEILTAFR